MKFCARAAGFLLSIFVISNVLQADSLALIPLSFDSLYPKTQYTHVEHVLKELWSDLDLLHTQRDLQERFIYQSDYLIDQYLLLERQLANLVKRNEEFSSYLVEDIEYLAYLVEQLETKSESMISILDAQRGEEVRGNVAILLIKCREHLCCLFEQNKEVII